MYLYKSYSVPQILIHISPNACTAAWNRIKKNNMILFSMQRAEFEYLFFYLTQTESETFLQEKLNIKKYTFWKLNLNIREMRAK